MPGNSDRYGARVDVLRSHFDVRGEVPVIIVEDLFTKTRQLIRVRQRNQIDGAGVLMSVITGEPPPECAGTCVPNPLSSATTSCFCALSQAMEVGK